MERYNNLILVGALNIIKGELESVFTIEPEVAEIISNDIGVNRPMLQRAIALCNTLRPVMGVHEEDLDAIMHRLEMRTYRRSDIKTLKVVMNCLSIV